MKVEEAIPKIRAFNRFYTNVISVLDRSVLNSGFSLAEARVLYEIGQLEPCSARKIMQVINIDEGYLSRILTKFSDTGLICKEQADMDKRKYYLTVSDKGKRHLDRLEIFANESIGQLTRNFSNQELSTLLNSMEIIHNLLSQTHETNT